MNTTTPKQTPMGQLCCMYDTSICHIQKHQQYSLSYQLWCNADALDHIRTTGISTGRRYWYWGEELDRGRGKRKLDHLNTKEILCSSLRETNPGEIKNTQDNLKQVVGGRWPIERKNILIIRYLKKLFLGSGNIGSIPWSIQKSCKKNWIMTILGIPRTLPQLCSIYSLHMKSISISFEAPASLSHSLAWSSWSLPSP